MNYFWHRFGILEKMDLRCFFRVFNKFCWWYGCKKLDVLLHFLKQARHFLLALSRGWGDAGVLCLCFQPSVFLERRTGELSSMKCQGEFRKCYTMTFYKYAADTFMYFWELIYSSTNDRIPVPIGKLSFPKQLISEIVRSLVQDTLKNNPFISLIFFPPNFNFPIRFDYYSRLISKFTSSQFWQTFQFNFTILKFFFLFTPLTPNVFVSVLLQNFWRCSSRWIALTENVLGTDLLIREMKFFVFLSIS